MFNEFNKVTKTFSNLIPSIKHQERRLKSGKIVGASNMPRSFDAREKWPDCIGPIRDQLYCGACWAFASSGMLGDRFCIHSNGQINVTLAPQDLVACNFENFGCSGGLLVNTVDFLQTEGVASEKCMPY